MHIVSINDKHKDLNEKIIGSDEKKMNLKIRSTEKNFGLNFEVV